jgi:spore maturation protein CgeB
MRITLFSHSLVSDWNHGNAHFLRGVARELLALGHAVDVLEPEHGWSMTNLLADAGPGAVADFHAAFPELSSRTYDPASIDLDAELDGQDLVIVHDWIEPALAARIGARRRRRDDHLLLFYDAHHRAATAPEQIAAFDLSGYDAALVFGGVIRELYAAHGWGRRAFVWHEAADTRLFRPLPYTPRAEDLVWIGNWGDGERSEELARFLLGPARAAGLSGSVHGVRYPPHARAAVRAAGLTYRGWLANHRAPEVYARHRMTVHVPRRAYVEALPGIPTIRVFEALACGIPLISAPWEDREGLFRAGEDFLTVRDGAEMTAAMRRLREDAEFAAALAAHGLARVRERHTCAHRAEELLAIAGELGLRPAAEVGA